MYIILYNQYTQFYIFIKHKFSNNAHNFCLFNVHILLKEKDIILILIFWSYSQFYPYILIVVDLVLTVNLLTRNTYVTLDMSD